MSASRRAPRVPFALLVTALLLGGLGLLLALNTASAANELTRHSLATKDQQVAAQVQQLRNEVALSAAPGNLASAATELGMVPAGNPAFIVLGTNGSATVLGKPKAVAGTPLTTAPASPKKSPAASPTPKAAKSTTPTAKSQSTTSSSRTSGHATKAHGARSASTSTTPAASPARPTPTPTPTPTLTLPGGHR